MATTANNVVSTQALKDARRELFFAITYLEPIEDVKKHLDATLKLGGNINQKYSEQNGDDFEARNPVHLAIDVDYLDALKLLLSVGVGSGNPYSSYAPAEFYINNRTPLIHIAIGGGNVELIKEVLEYYKLQDKAICYNFITYCLLLGGVPFDSLLDESEVSYVNQPSSEALKQAIIRFRTGKMGEGEQRPEGEIVFKYKGPIKALQYLIEQGLSLDVKNESNDSVVSPLAFVREPKKYAIRSESSFLLDDDKATQFKGATSPTTLVFTQKIPGLGNSEGFIEVTVEYDYTEVAKILENLAKQTDEKLRAEGKQREEIRSTSSTSTSTATPASGNTQNVPGTLLSPKAAKLLGIGVETPTPTASATAPTVHAPTIMTTSLSSLSSTPPSPPITYTHSSSTSTSSFTSTSRLCSSSDSSPDSPYGAGEGVRAKSRSSSSSTTSYSSDDEGGNSSSTSNHNSSSSSTRSASNSPPTPEAMKTMRSESGSSTSSGSDTEDNVATSSSSTSSTASSIGVVVGSEERKKVEDISTAIRTNVMTMLFTDAIILGTTLCKRAAELCLSGTSIETIKKDIKVNYANAIDYILKRIPEKLRSKYISFVTENMHSIVEYLGQNRSGILHSRLTNHAIDVLKFATKIRDSYIGIREREKNESTQEYLDSLLEQNLFCILSRSTSDGSDLEENYRRILEHAFEFVRFFATQYLFNPKFEAEITGMVAKHGIEEGPIHACVDCCVTEGINPKMIDAINAIWDYATAWDEYVYEQQRIKQDQRTVVNARASNVVCFQSTRGITPAPSLPNPPPIVTQEKTSKSSFWKKLFQ